MNKEADLNRWFKEKWVDISRKDESGKHPECGRSDADKGAYPKCRPSKKVSEETPKISKSLSKRDKKKAVEIKRRKERSSPSESAGGSARKPKYTKLSGDNMRYISKRAAQHCNECWDEETSEMHKDHDHKDHGDSDIEENFMIRSNLAQTASNCIAIHNALEEDGSIPEWCQEKIAVAASMIDTVYDYLTYEMGFDMEGVDKLLKNWSVPVDRS
jgi:hypothetical protein